MSRYIEVDALKVNCYIMVGDTTIGWRDYVTFHEIDSAPSIDIVFCKECKHRPLKEDADGKNYGFNLIEPNDGDGRCPCLVSDGWYSWMPEDDFYCGYGERENE